MLVEQRVRCLKVCVKKCLKIAGFFFEGLYKFRCLHVYLYTLLFYSMNPTTDFWHSPAEITTFAIRDFDIHQCMRHQVLHLYIECKCEYDQLTGWCIWNQNTRTFLDMDTGVRIATVLILLVMSFCKLYFYMFVVWGFNYGCQLNKTRRQDNV